MMLPSPLYKGILIRRYKRFLADIKLSEGRIITAHCPNSGSMKGCNIPGSPVLVSKSNNPRRKLPYTWELVYVHPTWVGINTQYPNQLVQEAIEAGIVQELAGYSRIRREVRLGENSRVDLVLEGNGRSRCFVEVKNVTLVEDGVARFPDAVTLRGQKHLHELMKVVDAGERGVIFFVVQREDCDRMAPADQIDPEYGRLLRLAANRGVEVLCYQARVSPREIRLTRRLPVLLNSQHPG
ncbi:MAG: DNA/RNA nuclease SfsA [Calditrichaeota bacterium]|nr:MAG: DNA/RNA nuclease SfsA [Calditrichota bacterium]